VALLTAYSYVRLSLAYPGSGGTVTFLNRAFGTGLLAGWLNTLLVVATWSSWRLRGRLRELRHRAARRVATSAILLAPGSLRCSRS
jgi:hypothetical protein